MLRDQTRASAGTGAAAAELGQQSSDRATLSPLRVLVVDTHTLVLRFMSFAFTAAGCAVHTASSADETLQLLSTEPVDLVVGDVDIPGLRGAEFLQAVTSKQPDVPVVLTSAAAAEGAALALRDRVYDYLKQPFAAEEVQRLIDRLTAARLECQKADDLSAATGTAGEAVGRIGDLALRSSDTAAFAQQALELVLAALGAEAAFIVLRDDEGHETVTPTGDRALSGRLVELLPPLREELYAGQRASVPLPARESVAVAAPIPGPERPIGVICAARRTGDTPWADSVARELPALARVVAVCLQKLILAENLEATMIDTISSFVAALGAKDVYLKGHSARVSLYVGEIGKMLGLPAGQVAMARRAGILHDLGMLALENAVYGRPSPLTSEGWAEVRRHPSSGADILKPLRFLAEEAEAVRRHHERYDGSGYPDGLKGDKIPLAARIIAVADAFDDMTSNRPYRASMPVEQALQEIVRNAGTQFDPAVTGAFARIPLARLVEIAGFYDTRAGAPADPAVPGATRLAGAKVTKGWSSAHRAAGEKRGSSSTRKVIGISRATARRQAREA